MWRVRAAAVGVVSLAATVGLWWAAVEAAGLSSVYAPTPAQVAARGWELRDYLAEQAVVTLTATALGFAAALATGVAVALLLVSSRWAARALMPPLVVGNAVPKVAVAPLLVLWLGFGTAPRVVLVWLIATFPILLATLAGLRSTPAEFGELAASLDAGRWQTFRLFRLPWALPQVFIGARVGAQLAVIGAVVAEVTTPSAGLGAVVVRSSASADAALGFAAVAGLAALSAGLFAAVAGLERAVVPWARATTLH